jgi:hypothetical protein
MPYPLFMPMPRQTPLRYMPSMQMPMPMPIPMPYPLMIPTPGGGMPGKGPYAPVGRVAWTAPARTERPPRHAPRAGASPPPGDNGSGR